MRNNDYVLSQTGVRLMELLRESLEREFSMEPEQIGMGIPGEDKRLTVCVYLYDIRKNTDMHMEQMVSVSATEMRYPSSYYDLYYMIVPCSYSDVRYRMEEVVKLLDVLLQVLGDIHYLDGIGEDGRDVEFALHDIDFDGKTKIWTGLNQSLHTALYCKAGPVEIQSARRKKIARVTDIQMDFVQGGS